VIGAAKNAGELVSSQHPAGCTAGDDGQLASHAIRREVAAEVTYTSQEA
jgi:hypothetical protein